MSKLYTTQQVADLFNVKNPTITYWKIKNKLPVTARVGNNKSYLFSQENILTFIINTHLGKYKNSTVDVISALTKMGLDKNIILPETKRFQSRSKLWISRFEIKPSKYALDISNNEHIQSQSRKDYIEKIVQIGTKSCKN